ncbi:VWA domain-containing protein [Salininema proteolyticum]|uniref:VWA domain-containing protein n=1 Tax=Salininema proteolyticum TaxID=1607685 RepID=A0ABV8TY41_9ACTN
MTTDHERWRLILGPAAEGLGPMSADGAARDAALEWLYGRDEERAERGVRSAGNEESRLTTVDWLGDIHRLFPKETVERLESDATEHYGIDDMVTNVEVLERARPNRALLKAVLKSKHLMNAEVLEAARAIVRRVVEELVERLRVEVRTAFHGTRLKRPSRRGASRDFDLRTTLRRNLHRWQPENRRVAIERPYFHTRQERHMRPWQLIILVDQSGSMLDSVIHSAVTASCLHALPGLKTHLIAFDSSVVDLTDETDDPVETLMKVQLGGGTDIAGAVSYGASLIENPQRAIVAVITDFYEGGSVRHLTGTVARMCQDGAHVLGLAALDEDASPNYDRETAGALARVGAHIGAMTPGGLAEFVAEKIGR